ncbi:hypothetical protein PCANC_26554 [Puccinia coronata f. sp. avenae]|uniref:Uncharacterized protein n=1 Tax=Puccinia coronata f. sp. avenae TaxID=200324 RepID=A0A2N5TJW0_9BASI|nr:hypothetical protein PCANC_26554 [Puccinia coronata f. sp. avenae]
MRLPRNSAHFPHSLPPASLSFFISRARVFRRRVGCVSSPDPVLRLEDHATPEDWSIRPKMNPEAEQDPFGDLFYSAAQSAIERILVDGTRHGVDFKAFDKQLDNQTELLSQDPSNSTLKAELARRRALRDETLKRIEELSMGIAQDLQSTLKKNFNNINISSSSSSSSSRKPSPQNNPPDLDHETDQHLVNHVKLLHERISKHALDVQRIDCEHQAAINQLKKQVTNQEEIIRTITRDLSLSRALTVGGEGGRTIDKTLKQSEKAEASSSNRQLDELHMEVQDIQKEARELVRSFLTILSKEIPVNLRQSVQVIQQDVDHTVETAIVNGHHHLAQLIRNLVDRFEPRIQALERLACQLDAPLPDLSAQSSPSSPKPTRLLRRPHSSLSTQISSAPESDEGCKQQ